MNKINIAVVGLNFGRHIAMKLAASAESEHFELAAVCDADESRALQAAEQFGVRAFTNFDELLKERNIEAIALFTGPAGRADLIGRIIDAGKHVMTTKPFEMDSDAALNILRKAKSRGIVVHLNSPSPLLPPDLRNIKEWIRTYDLGQWVGGRCDVWAGYREKADGSWYDDPVRCPVAPVFRLGIYLINDLVQLFGRAESVQVMHSRMFTKRPTPDNALLGIKFENGPLCSIYASFCVKDGQSYKNSMVLNFERGTIARNIEPLRQEEVEGVSRMSLVTLDAEKRSVIERKDIRVETHGNYQWDYFYSSIRGDGQQEDATPDSVAEAVRIVEAMARAERSGRMEMVCR